MNLLIFALVLVAAAWSLRLFMAASVRKRSAELVDASIEPGTTDYDAEDRGRLTVWLSLAGFRGPSAATTFLGITAGMIALALAFIFVMAKSGAIDTMAETLSAVPGGVGDALALVAVGAP